MFKRGFKSRMKGLVTSFPECFYILKAFTCRFLGWKVFCFHCQFTNLYHRTRNSSIANSQNIFSCMQAVILQKLIPQDFSRNAVFVGFRSVRWASDILPQTPTLSLKKNKNGQHSVMVGGKKRAAFNPGGSENKKLVAIKTRKNKSLS